MKTGEPLSVLIFSRDDTEKTLGLIDTVYDIADQIVVIDSSGALQLQQLRLEKRTRRLQKLLIDHTVALGYPEPLRMYALRRCKHRWVFLIDADERLSEGLVSRIEKMINSDSVSAYAIKRYEESDGLKKGFWTWQVRLFDKEKVRFKGMIHEQPETSGKMEGVSDEDAFITHMKHENASIPPEYEKMRIFLDRMSYKAHNDRIESYIGKLAIPKKPGDSALGRALIAFLNRYQRITGKRPDDELSRLDYILFYMFTEFGYALKKKDIRWFIDVFPIRLSQMQKADRAKNGGEAMEVFEISKILSDVGIIKFLRLDQDKVVARLT